MEFSIDRTVLRNGELDPGKIWGKETLYTGMTGKKVERFYVSPGQSYIFKPLTNNSQAGKEIWVYEHVLRFFPPIYPRLIACSKPSLPEHSWIIFEDLGRLQHAFNEEIALQVTKLTAWWHSLPSNQWADASLKGPKPFIQDIVSDVLMHKEQLARTPLMPLAKGLIDHIYRVAECCTFSDTAVLSHGDLHAGNYVVVNGRTLILDWEHAHLNVPFWDLYHVLDMSHPVFPKTVTPETRELVLDGYLDEFGRITGKSMDWDRFKREYYVFSSVFSMWMLMLIQKDLRAGNGKWTESQLRSQLEETMSSFLQCAERV